MHTQGCELFLPRIRWNINRASRYLNRCAPPNETQWEGWGGLDVVLAGTTMTRDIWRAAAKVRERECWSSMSTDPDASAAVWSGESGSFNSVRAATSSGGRTPYLRCWAGPARLQTWFQVLPFSRRREVMPRWGALCQIESAPLSKPLSNVRNDGPGTGQKRRRKSAPAYTQCLDGQLHSPERRSWLRFCSAKCP